MVALALVAAMAFDIGMIMLERRDQQNAADAAALAGARCLNLPRPCDPLARAREVATLNGFTQGARVGEVVTVSASANLIQVEIDRGLPSLFAGIVGRATWAVSALAVAVNMDNAPPFASMIALSPDACPAFKVTGTGVVNSNGDIQVNSSCSQPDGDAFLLSGQGSLVMQNDGLACYVVGDWSIGGKASGTYCDPPTQGTPLDWPVSAMPENTDWPTPPLQEGGATTEIPSGCPGSTTPATDAAPATCQFQASYKGTTWRLYPGYYPGGIKIQAGTFYLEPGIYHLAGGGFVAIGAGTDPMGITSVDPGGTTLGGGILLFNTTHSIAGNGPININGTDATINLWPLGGIDENCEIGPSGGWNRYLIFQDPAVTNAMIINGGANDMEARGLILAPTADVTVNGGSGELTLDAIIAWTFKINGNGGTINVLYDNCALPTFTGYGLIV